MNVFVNLINTATNLAFPLLTYPYITRIFAASGIGKIFFFTSISNYAILLSSLGISTYGIRVVAKVRDNKENLSKVVTELLIINLILSVIIVGLLIFSVPFVSIFKTELLLLIINVLVVITTPLGLSWLFSGLEQYSYITKCNLFFKLISLGLIFIFVKEAYDYHIYALIMAFSVIGTYICNLLYSRKFIHISINSSLKFKYHFKPMFYLFASLLAVSIYTNLDTIMLGFINGYNDVGYYTISSKIKWLLLALVNSVSVVLLPRLSYLLNNTEYDSYNNVLKKSIHFIFMVTIPLSIFFIIASYETIKLLSGDGYDTSILCLQILMPIIVISGFSNVTGNQILIPKGKDSCFMKAVVCGALVNVILNAILLPSLGAIGASLSTLIAEFAQLCIQIYYSKNEIKGNIDKKFLITILIMSVLAGLIVIVVKLTLNFSILINFLIISAFFWIFYILFIYICYKAKIIYKM